MSPGLGKARTIIHSFGGGPIDSPRDRQCSGMAIRRCSALLWLVGLFLLASAEDAFATPRSVVGGWPLDEPVETARGFDPPALRWNAGHRGVDLTARRGQAVHAAAAGTVTFAGRVAGRGVVVVDHGSVRTTYEPVLADVAVGEVVAAGQVIGRIGTGSHCAKTCLHWGLRRGAEYLDPLQLIGGGDHGGRVRLVGAAQRRVAERAAAERAVATVAAVGSMSGARSGSAEPAGRHGFLHPVPGGITSAFGMRFHPVLRIWKLHDGTDFGAACGTPIRAPQAGLVSGASFSAGYGNRLTVDHGLVGGRHVVTGFNHATRYVVGVGQRVDRGQVIGYVGNTGFSTGCHLHLMLWLNGALTNPMSYI